MLYFHICLAMWWEAEEARGSTSRLIVTAASADAIGGGGISSLDRHLTGRREKRLLHLRSYNKSWRAWIVDVIQWACTTSTSIVRPWQ